MVKHKKDMRSGSIKDLRQRQANLKAKREMANLLKQQKELLKKQRLEQSNMSSGASLLESIEFLDLEADVDDDDDML
jgi:hypothetical protein